MRLLVIAALAALLPTAPASAAANAPVGACPTPTAETYAQPAYPPDAYVTSVQGRARARLSVLADGTVAVAKVERAEPSGTFDAVVLEAVRAWRFTHGPLECWHDFRFNLEGDREPAPLAYEDEERLLAELAADRPAFEQRFAALRARCIDHEDALDPRTVKVSRIPTALPAEPAAAVDALQRVAPCALARYEQLAEPEMLDLAAAFWSRGLGETQREAVLLRSWRDARAGSPVQRLQLARARSELLMRFDQQIRYFISDHVTRFDFAGEDAMKRMANATSRYEVGDRKEAIAMLRRLEMDRRSPATRATAAMLRATWLISEGQAGEALDIYRSIADDPKGDPSSRFSAFTNLLDAADQRGDADDWEKVYAGLRASKLLPPALDIL